MSMVVRVRGLPFETTEAELIGFFTGLPVTSAIITYDLSGRPSGEGFVTFGDAESAKAALSFNRQSLGRRYLEVFESTAEEMTSKASAGHAAAAAQETDSILRLRGLPFNCSISQVVEFFEGFSVSDRDVTLGIVADGKFAGQPSGEAWVQFASQEMALAALHGKNKQMIGGRYVELFPSTTADRDTSRLKPGPKHGGSMYMQGGMPMQSGWSAPAPVGGDSVVKMRGLPFTVTAHDVVQFFAPEFPISAQQVSLTQGLDGRPSGQGFVTFSSRAIATRAATAKNRQYLGSRYVELSQEASSGMHFGGGFGGGSFAGGPVVGGGGGAAARAQPYSAGGARGWEQGGGSSDPAMMGMLMQMMNMLKGGKGSGW